MMQVVKANVDRNTDAGIVRCTEDDRFGGGGRAIGVVTTSKKGNRTATTTTTTLRMSGSNWPAWRNLRRRRREKRKKRKKKRKRRNERWKYYYYHYDWNYNERTTTTTTDEIDRDGGRTEQKGKVGGQAGNPVGERHEIRDREWIMTISLVYVCISHGERPRLANGQRGAGGR
jgi:hypothetical protein